MIEDYRNEISVEIRRNPRDLAWHYRLTALEDIERRLRLLSANGLRVIQGGKEES
jgi:hypothetical protein